VVSEGATAEFTGRRQPIIVFADIALLVVSIWALVTPSSVADRIFGALGVLFFGGALPVGMASLFGPPPRLRISEQSIEWRGFGWDYSVSWGDVVDISVRSLFAGWTTRPYSISFRLDNREAATRAIKKRPFLIGAAILALGRVTEPRTVSVPVRMFIGTLDTIIEEIERLSGRRVDRGGTGNPRRR